MENCCTLIRGDFYISDWLSDCVGGLSDIICEGQPKAFRNIGNVINAQLNIDASIKGRQNKNHNLALDVLARLPINGVDLSITVGCTSSRNLYMALFGEVPDEESGVYTDDYCFDELEEGIFFKFTKNGASSDGLDVFLRNSNGDLVKTLIDGIDFIFNKSGIELIRDIDPETGVTLRMIYSYNTLGFHEIDFFKKNIGYKTIFLKGTNYIDASGKSFNLLINKALITPVNQLDLLSGESFLTLVLNASVERDNDSWFKITKEE